MKAFKIFDPSAIPSDLRQRQHFGDAELAARETK